MTRPASTDLLGQILYGQSLARQAEHANLGTLEYIAEELTQLPIELAAAALLGALQRNSAIIHCQATEKWIRDHFQIVRDSKLPALSAIQEAKILADEKELEAKYGEKDGQEGQEGR